jgi:hypothetical protein
VDESLVVLAALLILAMVVTHWRPRGAQRRPLRRRERRSAGPYR